MTDSNPGQDPWAGTWKDKAYFADLCCYATQDAIKMFLPICCKTLFFLLFTSVHHPFFSLVMRHILNPQATLRNLVLSKRYKGFGATGIILSISISPVPMPHSETQTCSKTPRSKQVQMDLNSHHLKHLNQGFSFWHFRFVFFAHFCPLLLSVPSVPQESQRRSCWQWWHCEMLSISASKSWLIWWTLMDANDQYDHQSQNFTQFPGPSNTTKISPCRTVTMQNTHGTWWSLQPAVQKCCDSLISLWFPIWFGWNLLHRAQWFLPGAHLIPLFLVPWVPIEGLDFRCCRSFNILISFRYI